MLIKKVFVVLVLSCFFLTVLFLLSLSGVSSIKYLPEKPSTIGKLIKYPENWNDYWYEWRESINLINSKKIRTKIYMSCNWPYCAIFTDPTADPHVLKTLPQSQCPISCTWVNTYDTDSDAIVIIPDNADKLMALRDNNPFHRKDIYKILLDVEPSSLKPLKDIRPQIFDAIGTYRENATIPTTISPFEYTPFSFYTIPFGPSWEHREKAAIALFSHDRFYSEGPHRIALAKELNTTYPVHSYGRAWVTKELDKDDPLLKNDWVAPYGIQATTPSKIDPSWIDPIFKKHCGRSCKSEQIVLMARYRYVLSFENTVHDAEFHTRVWDAWYAGAIPIVYGGPGLELYAPGKHSYIDVKDWDYNMTAIGEHLEYLDSNFDEYLKYHQWRFETPNEKFVTKVWRHSADSWNCRVCIWTAEQRMKGIEAVTADHI